jgi:ABC-type transport system involved in multi-copper enzyme maturation permease subunit
MVRLLPACGDWLRQNLAWSNRRGDWQERLGLLALAAAAALGWWGRDGLSAGPRLALGGMALLALAVLARRGWLKLVGPVALYELVRATRRSHFVLYRLYAYFLFILLALFYCVWTVASPNSAQELRLPAAEMAAFGGTFVFTFLALQLLALAVLTPAYTAGVLAEEKARGTLEFLLATDLRNREIVLGKLVARLGNLLLILLTGLPAVAFLQFLGGIDPLLVLAGFAATGVTLVGLAGLSVLNSVYARTPRGAIVLTFLEIAAYLVLSTLAATSFGATGLFTTPVPGLGRFCLHDLLYWLDGGNPLLLVSDLTQDLARGAHLADILPGRLGDYAVFHGLLALACVGWASARLRVVFRKQVYSQARSARRARGRPRPVRVGRWPMLWKETRPAAGLRLGWFGRAVVAVLVVGSFLPLLAGPPGGVTASYLGLWVRFAGALVACLLLLQVAVHAATALSSEREHQTFDGLLSTPLSAAAILVGKWLGSVLSVRWGWVWLGTIWGTGVLAGGLEARALPVLLVAWLVYAAALAVVGLWFSLVSRSGLRATVLTLLLALGLGSSYLLSLSLLPFSGWLNESDWFLVRLNQFLQGLSPLASLGWLLPSRAGLDPAWGPKAAWELPTALLGLLLWAGGGLTVWVLLDRRFRALTGRQAVRRPEGSDRRPDSCHDCPSPALPVPMHSR